MLDLKDGQLVFVKESFLRRKFPGWHHEHTVWHHGYITFMWEEADAVSLTSAGVNVMIQDIRAGEMYVACNPFVDES